MRQRFQMRGTVYISDNEWIEFFKQHVPGYNTAEISIDPSSVRVDEHGDLVFSIAMNTECHPCEETYKPHWLRD